MRSFMVTLLQALRVGQAIVVPNSDTITFQLVSISRGTEAREAVNYNDSFERYLPLPNPECWSNFLLKAVSHGAGMADGTTIAASAIVFT